MVNTTLKNRLMIAAATALGLAATACGSAPVADAVGTLHAASHSTRAKGIGGASTADPSTIGALTCGGGSCSGHDAGVSAAPAAAAR